MNTILRFKLELRVTLQVEQQLTERYIPKFFTKGNTLVQYFAFVQKENSRFVFVTSKFRVVDKK